MRRVGGVSGHPGTLVSPFITGRGDELAAVVDALATTGTIGVLITGEAGIGKSFLADAVLAQRRAQDGPTHSLYGSAALAEIPLGVFAGELGSAAAYAGSVPAIAVKSALAQAGAPVMICIDDVDLVDPQSTAVLVSAAEAGVAQLVMTQRSDVSSNDGLGRVLTNGSVVRFELDVLDEVATAALAEQIVGGDLTAASHRLVWELTCGNPLYVRELVAAVVEADTISLTPSGADIGKIPAKSDRLADVLAARLGDLSPDARAALARIAAIEPTSEAVIQPYIDAAMLDLLDRRGLICSVLTGRRLVIRTAHPLHGEVLRASLSAHLLRQLREEAAARILELGAHRADDRFRLSTWALEGVGTVDGVTAREAAGMAAATGEFSLAAQFSAISLDASPSVELAQLLGFYLYEAGEFDLFRDHQPVWEMLVESEADRVEYDELVATAWFWRGNSGDPADALAHAATNENGDRSRAVAAALLVHRGRVRDGVELAESLGELKLGSSGVHAALALGQGLRARGRPAAAAARLAGEIDRYRLVGLDAFVVSDVVLAGVRVLALAEAGDFAEIELVVSAGASRWRDSGNACALSLTESAHAWACCLRGDFERAGVLVRRATEGFLSARQPAMVSWGVGLAARIEAESGNTEVASKLLAELDARPDHPAKIFQSTADQARAIVAHQNGFPDEAERVLVASAGRDLALGNVASVVESLHVLARLGRAAAGAELLSAVADVDIDGRLLPVQIEFITGAIAGDAAALGDCAKRFEQIGTMRFALDAALAAAFAARSDSYEAKRWLRLAADLGGAPDVGLVAAELTPREREVAQLVTHGLPSREVAERLHISRRTVESHLSRIYQKLDVTDRSSLTERLVSDGG